MQTGDRLFLEAGNPVSPWVKDLEHQSIIQLFGNGLEGDYTFVIRRNGHNEIRKLMRDKYGWRDLWVTTIFDTSSSSLVEATAMTPNNSLLRTH